MVHLEPKLQNDLPKPSGSKTQLTQIGLESGRHSSQKAPGGPSLLKHLGPKLQNDLPKPSGSKTQLTQISLEAGRDFSQDAPWGLSFGEASGT